MIPAILDDMQKTPSDKAWLNLYQILGDLEAQMLQAALDMASGDKSQAARFVKINRTTFVEKCAKYNIIYRHADYTDEYLHKWQIYQKALLDRALILDRLILGLKEANARREPQAASIIKAA